MSENYFPEGLAKTGEFLGGAYLQSEDKHALIFPGAGLLVDGGRLTGICSTKESRGLAIFSLDGQFREMVFLLGGEFGILDKVTKTYQHPVILLRDGGGKLAVEFRPDGEEKRAPAVSLNAARPENPDQCCRASFTLNDGELTPDSNDDGGLNVGTAERVCRLAVKELAEIIAASSPDAYPWAFHPELRDLLLAAKRSLERL